MRKDIPLYEIVVEENDEVRFVSLVHRPAIQRDFLAFSESVPMAFNEERQELYGPAMIADMPIYRKDNKRGEFYITFSKETVRKMAQKFFESAYQSKINLFHDIEQQPGDVFVFASWIADSTVGIKPLEGFEDVADGSWFIGVKVNNQDTWNKIKEQKVKGFSIEGVFGMREKKLSADEELYNQILEVLEQVDMGSEDQQRDERGRWGEGGYNGGGKSNGNGKDSGKESTPRVSPEKVREVIEKAKEVGKEVDDLGKSIAEKFGGTVSPLSYKEADSITRKVNDEMNGDITQLKDAVRNTVVVSYDKLDTIYETLKSDTKTFERVKLQDPDHFYGYKGIVTNVRLSNGLIGEMQVNTPGMIYAKSSKEFALKVMGEKTYNEIARKTGLEGGKGHKYYEEIRKIDPLKASPAQKERFRQLVKESREYYEKFYGL